MTTIDYKALAERIDADATVLERNAGSYGRIQDLRTVVTLLDGMAEEKPVGWLVTGGRLYEDVPCSSLEYAELRQRERDDGSQIVPLYLHPAPQPQPERQPVSEPTEQVTCNCGDEYPATSFEAGYICAAGRCQNCDLKPSSEPFDNADDLIAHLRKQCEPTEAQINAAAIEIYGSAESEYHRRFAARALRAALAAKDEK